MVQTTENLCYFLSLTRKKMGALDLYKTHLISALLFICVDSNETDRQQRGERQPLNTVKTETELR